MSHDSPTQQAAAAIRAALAEGYDVAEILADALCTVAAEQGGTWTVLANRPGSWEASHIRALMAGTVGENDEDLGRYNTDQETDR